MKHIAEKIEWWVAHTGDLFHHGKLEAGQKVETGLENFETFETEKQMFDKYPQLQDNEELM